MSKTLNIKKFMASKKADKLLKEVLEDAEKLIKADSKNSK